MIHPPAAPFQQRVQAPVAVPRLLTGQCDQGGAKLRVSSKDQEREGFSIPAQQRLKDWVTLDALDLEIHFVKENWMVSPSSRSSEKLMHGMKVLMAKNYIDNLSEETVKGMTEKAHAGMYPSYAPVGYRNVDGADGKRIIVPDPDAASVITELFGRFAVGPTH